MSIIFQGGQKAMVEGLLQSGAALELALVTGNFTAEQDAINLSDFVDLGEFGGVGYQRLDCENVVMAYDTVEDEYQLSVDQGEFNAPNVTVAAGAYDAEGLLVILRVDGSEANDIAVGWTGDGGFPINGVGTSISYTPHADGLLVLRAATP